MNNQEIIKQYGHCKLRIGQFSKHVLYLDETSNPSLFTVETPNIVDWYRSEVWHNMTLAELAREFPVDELYFNNLKE